MSTFNEAQHPRTHVGRFATKTNRSPSAGLADGGRPHPGERRGPCLVRGSFGDFELAEYRSLPGTKRRGFTATLRYRGRDAGRVVQFGAGGATEAQIADIAAREALDELLRNEWGFDDGDGTVATEAQVLDALALDHEVSRRLRRERRMGTLPIMLADDIAAVEAAQGVSQYG